MTRRSPGARANAKGKAGQTKGKNYLASLGFDAVNCAAHGVTGGQDLQCNDLPNVWIECKYGVQGMDLHTKLLKDAWEQAAEGAGWARCGIDGDGFVCGPWTPPSWPVVRSEPVVLWKPPRKPWRLTWMEPCGLVTTTGDDAIKAALVRLNGGK